MLRFVCLFLLLLLLPAGTFAQAPADTLSSGLLIDDSDKERVEITAYWARITSEKADSLIGDTALHDGGVRADGVVRFFVAPETPAFYHIYLHVPVVKQRQLATNVPVDVRHRDGKKRLRVNMRAHAGGWLLLGRFFLTPNTKHFVEVRNDAVDGDVVADAVLLCPGKN